MTETGNDRALWLAHSAAPPPDAQALSLPSVCVTQELGGQIIAYCIPPSFNGNLLVYAHGYAAPQNPIALPSELALPEWQTLVELFLTMGYGFATASYSKNGLAIQQAEVDLLALVDYVKAQLPGGAVKRVLLAGVSEGGLITTMMVEKHPDVFAGGLAMSGPLGGMPYQVDYMGDFRVVFDYLFPGIFGFGAVGVPEDAYLNWDAYAAAITAGLEADPDKTKQLFSIRLAKASTVARDPADRQATGLAGALELLWYNIFGTPDAIATAGGQPYDNAHRFYWGCANIFALNARVERDTPNPAARAYVREYYEPTGSLQVPLVTLHTTRDPVVPFRHETLYLARAVAAGSALKLVVLPIIRWGHSAFTPTDLLGGLGLLLLRTGALLHPRLQRAMETLPEPLQ